MDQGQEYSGSFFGLAVRAGSPVLPCKEVHLLTDPPLEQEQEELKERTVNASHQADAANNRVVDRAGAQPPPSPPPRVGTQRAASSGPSCCFTGLHQQPHFISTWQKKIYPESLDIYSLGMNQFVP